MYILSHTAVFIKQVPGVYTHLMENIYLSLSAVVAMGTFSGNPRYLYNLVYIFRWARKYKIWQIHIDRNGGNDDDDGGVGDVNDGDEGGQPRGHLPPHPSHLDQEHVHQINCLTD